MLYSSKQVALLVISMQVMFALFACNANTEQELLVCDAREMNSPHTTKRWFNDTDSIEVYQSVTIIMGGGWLFSNEINQHMFSLLNSSDNADNESGSLTITYSIRDWVVCFGINVKVDHMRTLPEGLSDNVSTDL